MAKVKYYLDNRKCDNCPDGCVQLYQHWKRGGTVTQTVSGCLDCKKDFGIRQAMNLPKYEGNNLVWP